MPVLGSIIVLCVAVAVKWKLRRYAWFWITVFVFTVIHVALVLFVPWTSKWVPAPVSAIVGTADLIVMIAILDVVSKFMKRSKGR